MKNIDMLAAILVIVGALNWGLVALFNFDLVAAITGAGAFGNKNVLGAIVYTLVGAAAIYQLVSWSASRRRAQVR